MDYAQDNNFREFRRQVLITSALSLAGIVMVLFAYGWYPLDMLIVAYMLPAYYWGWSVFPRLSACLGELAFWSVLICFITRRNDLLGLGIACAALAIKLNIAALAGAVIMPIKLYQGFKAYPVRLESQPGPVCSALSGLKEE